MESEEQKTFEDWRDEVSDESKEILKVADGEEVVFEFKDEGVKKTHADYGTSIVFLVNHNELEKLWYVNEHNYSLLRQIKLVGELVNKKVHLSREGSKKSDTRYTLVEVKD